MIASLMTSQKQLTYLLILSLLPALAALAGCRKSETVALKVGALNITQSEFDKAFQNSGFPNDPASRQRFTEQYVNEKLILMEAERQGFDKDPRFLDEIQTLWEERLLKSAMLAKFEQSAGSIDATEEEVDQIYQESKTDSSLPAAPQVAKDKIRMMIVQEKQNQLLLRWIDSLRSQTKISINEQKLGLNK